MVQTLKFSLAALLCFLATPSSEGFGSFLKPKASVGKGASEAVVQEALDIYEAKFKVSENKKAFKPFFTQWGVPETDIDGSQVKKDTGSKKRLVDADVKTQRAAFNEIAKIYGEEAALQMVKDLPYCLAFKRSNFAGNFAVYEEVFGKEEAKAMVSRNPGLLAISPEDAARNTNEQTMVFSYLIGYTRPIGDIALPGLLLLLATPGIEQVSGIPIRTTLLAFLTNTSVQEAAQSLQAAADPLGVL